ncbi:MAG TPA: energy transducer TonB [Sphingomonas sp.]|nr:energy transducer TonB [Sphingomonas sp.]
MLTGQGKWLMVTVIATCITLAVSILVLGVMIARQIGMPDMTALSGVTATIKAATGGAPDDDARSDAMDGYSHKGPFRSSNPVDWFGPDDYPIEARHHDIEGKVRFDLTIDAAGHATSCTILESSGSAALDEGTCRLAVERAELAPLPQTGRPPEHYTNSVVRRLAD